ncbi:MAG: DUF1573 domain-containing protein [Candidatus Wildermuthbacteria bacterium]|nr:DUF1573 domain-containing protein [Candidatus Wildermuthbacteria bacterium]
MNKKIVILVFGAVLLFGGIVFFARPQEKRVESLLPTSKGMLAALEQSFDFGTISMKAGNVSHMFQFKNTGEEPVTIGQMYTSCMCTDATLTIDGKKFGPYGMPGHGFVPKVNKSIGPDEEATVEVVFDPAAHGPAGIGKIQRSIILENNAGDPFEFLISANVTP